MIKLHNKFITANIDKMGAELKSLVCEGREILWQGDETGKTKIAPILFPICGGFKNGGFTYNGEFYGLSRHGFARDSEFTLEKKSKKSATFLLKSNEDTLAVYPFQFELRVIFTLSNKSIIIEYDIQNKTDGEMYFSIGSHETYLCEGKIENYDVYFKKRESLINCLCEENGMVGERTEQITKFSKFLPIYPHYFDNDSLVFKNMSSRSLVLRNRVNGHRIKIEYPGFNYFIIYRRPNQQCVCLEPWAGFPPQEKDEDDITKREGIMKIKKNGSKKLMHKITVLEDL